MAGYVYILANRRRGATYIGVTNDLTRRVYEHREKAFAGHTRKYNITRLVFFEMYATVPDAIVREKTLKKWRQRWKWDLIENENPHWDDLWAEIAGDPL